MSDLIDREQAIVALDELCDRVCQYSKEQRAVMCGACPLGSAFDVIENMPVPDRWLFINENNEPKFWQYNIRFGKISPITDLEDTSITWRVGLPFKEITGHWIKHDDEVLGLTYECSVCHIEGMVHSPYCPNCGARMREGDAE